MSTSSHAPFYDLFKLIIAIILLLLFLLLFQFQPGESPQPVAPINTLTLRPPTPTVAPPTQTPTSPTTTSEPTETPLPTNTATPETTNSPAPIEGSPTPEPLPTPTIEISSELETCAVSPPQLHVGMKATIQRRLNFRSSPGIMDNWLLTNIPGTQVDVVGGPVCTRYQNGVAYLWWQIKLPDGSVGWSAEASAVGYLYFMEPVK